jgi:hypothetical protein
MRLAQVGLAVSTALRDRLRPRTVGVAGAFLFAGAALSLNRVFAGPLLDLIGSRISAAGVIAVAMTSSATCTCLSSLRSPVMRPLGGTLVFLTAYELLVLASYEEPSRAWSVFSTVLWPSIPFAYAAWGSAALAIARRARGEPIGLASDWSRFGWLGARLPGRRVLRPSHLWLWVAAVAFAAASAVPDFVSSGVAVPGVSWHGQPYQPHWPYAVISGWGVITLFGSALIVEHAWKTQRTSLSESQRLLVRGSVVVSFLTASCAVVLVAAAVTGLWPEPVIDLVIACATILYVLVFTARDQAPPVAAVLRLHLTENALVIGLGAGVPLATGASPALGGLEAVFFTVSLNRLLHVRRSRFAEDTPAVRPAETDPGVATNTDAEDELTAPEKDGLRSLLAETSKHTLRLFVTSQPLLNSNVGDDSGLTEQGRLHLASFLEAATGILGADAAARLLRLFYEVACTLETGVGGRPQPRRPLDPSPMFVGRVMCYRRGDVTADPAEREKLRVDERRLSLFAKAEPSGKADGLGHLRFQGQIALMDEDEVLHWLEALASRAASPRAKGAIRDLLEDGLEQIRKALIDD